MSRSGGGSRGWHDPIDAQIAQFTALLRSSDDPFFLRLRELLEGRGVDPQTALPVELFPDDEGFEFGILVTADRRAVQFGFSYPEPEFSKGTFVEWRDITDRFAATGYGAGYGTPIRHAFRLLDEAS
jgi:hypothetical protein